MPYSTIQIRMTLSDLKWQENFQWHEALCSLPVTAELIAITCLCLVLGFTAPSLYLLVSWAGWDWPLMLWTNHHPSVLWHCWLGHLTRKIVSEITYNVSSGTLNPTLPYHTIRLLKTDTGLTYHLILNHFSSSNTCLCGVPQGSVIGALLFTIHTTHIRTGWLESLEPQDRQNRQTTTANS